MMKINIDEARHRRKHRNSQQQPNGSSSRGLADKNSDVGPNLRGAGGTSTNRPARPCVESSEVEDLSKRVSGSLIYFFFLEEGGRGIVPPGSYANM